MTELDLLYTEVEEDLRASVRDLLTDRCPPSAVTALYDGDRSAVAGLWKALACDLGLAGLLVPESRGGAGGSAREAAVVLEELGRAVAPVPFLTSAVVATTALLDGDDGDLLAEVAAGARTAALLVPLPTAPHDTVPAAGAGPAGGVVGAGPAGGVVGAGPAGGAVRADRGQLTGTVTGVAGVLDADVLLVPATTPDGIGLFAVPVAAAGVDPVVSLDMTRQLADVTLDGAAGSPVAADAESVVRRALRTGAALLASEQIGLAGWCLHETVGHLRQRTQFGRVLGGFQALKHRLADLAVDLDSATAAARYAAAALAAGDPDTEIATAVAQAYCSDAAVRAAEEAVQLHGGIGMTWEHPAHLYLKRAKADQIAFGTAGRHRAHLAGLVELPAP
ncbi:acyl-CoA dehydrogenase family protein [Pseudonocardia kongjuensis]|uniref:Acyl-CoA dehydrogenase family protein n=1 Tax=Pseudonocardia kongjuensis TaxID=102227 RepID=A0ABP4IU72_9PSEU